MAQGKKLQSKGLAEDAGIAYQAPLNCGGAFDQECCAFLALRHEFVVVEGQYSLNTEFCLDWS
jgi:hypothetical protein